MMDEEGKWLDSQIKLLHVQNDKYYDEARAARNELYECKCEEFRSHNKRMDKIMDYSIFAMFAIGWICIISVIIS